MTDEILRKMAQSIIDGDADVAVTLAKESIATNMDPLESISRGFVVGVTPWAMPLAAGRHSCRSLLWPVRR
jgi:methanogenic corrinoid protein MtbC1